MTAYRLLGGVYTGETIQIMGGILPENYTTVEPIPCDEDEVVRLVGDRQIILKKSDLVSAPVENSEADLSQLREQKIADFERRRIQLERAGCPFVFGEVGDIIQTRDERDFININGVVTNAILFKAAGVTDPVILFRAQSDTNYQLTPDQAIALGIAVASRSTQLYARKWELKDAIDSADSIDDINAIQWLEN
jgi:hypothetical protein